MKKIELSYEGTVFNKIAGNEKKAMYYNVELNNLLIVTTDEKAEEEKAMSMSYTELYQNGELDEDEIEGLEFDENGNVIISLDGEDFNDIIEDAIGFIVGDRWDNLCEAAEYTTNTTILIHKPYHTTTDYIINYDLNPSKLKTLSVAEAIKDFEQSLPELIGYKTIEVMKGKAYRYGEIPEEVFETHFE
ncbi:hypothetical protein QFZ31_006382 [Neobacillus niacini]|uniref:hypothetical protein n=1 Tax=Neobacillus driksii TaxID=3035913 RepID=UPI002787A0D3|nr:hypothetical protein [Neobacillus niacini]MDQ0976504.1 hypothetical protein [Neobacillus niacini]